ncbi:amino acid transporter [Poronia punctata]|nr:amino acid transporter [Poronia punctata]
MAAESGETRPLLSDGQETDNEHRPLIDPGHVAESADEVEAQRGLFSRNLGTAEAFAIVISIVIGSGIFTSPGSIDTNVPSPGVALVVWLVGGLLAWTGASTMAELGTAIPGEGGVQPYLRYIFGDLAGFLAAWTWVVAVMPATLATLSIVFVESIYSAAGITDQADRIEHKLLAILILTVISVANSINTKASTRLNSFFVVTKFLTIGAIVVAGLAVVIIVATQSTGHPPGDHVGGHDWFSKPWFGTRPTVNPDGSTTDWDRLSEWEILGHYSTAIYGALWAYSGWDKAIYVSAELSAPATQLPLAINSAIPTIVFCFIAANAAYYILLPWDVVSTTDSVAVTAITRLLGRGFGIVAAIFICLVVAGSLLGNSFVASRMTVAAANRDWLPRVFARLGRIVSIKTETEGDDDEEVNEHGTTTETAEDPSVVLDAVASDAPINAVMLSAILTAFYILVGNFRALLTFNGLGEYSFFFLTVLGAIILRYREPDLKRPYKPFILVPAVFAVLSGFVLVRGAIFAPVPAAVLVGLWILGGLVYYGRREYARRRAG